MTTAEIIQKQELLGVSLPRLQAFFERLGEKPFRARQVFEWIYKKNVTDFESMSNLSQELRDRLAREFKVSSLSPARKQVSQRDGTTKFLFRCDDGELIESVFLPHDGRNTACISTQVGCAMACAFCATTGDSGFSRNLRASRDHRPGPTPLSAETGQELHRPGLHGHGRAAAQLGQRQGDPGEPSSTRPAGTGARAA